MRSAALLLLGLSLGCMLTIASSFLVNEDILNFGGSKVKDLEEENYRIITELNNLRNLYDELLSNYTRLQLEYITGNSQGSSLQSSGSNYIDENDRIINRQYTWTYNYEKWTLNLSIPEQLYHYYRNIPRSPSTDYSVYVTHPYDDKYIESILMKFNEITLRKGFSETKKIGLLISFIQSLPYTSDAVTTGFDEYPRYPVETLVDYGGDCEDTSILTAALLKSMAKDVILLKLYNHLSVGIAGISSQGYYYLYNGKNYYYLETTGEGWGIGDLPDEYKGTSATIYDLIPTPIITHNWTSKWEGSKIVLTVTVENLGSENAKNYYIETGFDTGDNTWWNNQKSLPFDLPIGGKISFSLILQPPKNKYTRLIVEIWNSDGKSVDSSTSKWFNT